MPNITGTVSEVVSTSGGLHGSGAFTVTNNGRGGGDSAWRYGTVKFDASLSNEIYGKSDKVLPESFALIAQIKY